MNPARLRSINEVKADNIFRIGIKTIRQNYITIFGSLTG